MTFTIRQLASSINSFKVSGNNVVWDASDGNDLEIYLNNGSTTIQLTDNSSDEISTQIAGNNIVWGSLGNNESPYGTISFYNGSSTITLDYATEFLNDSNTTIPLTDTIPSDNVVWAGYDTTDFWDDDEVEIYLYNGSSVIQLTDNSFGDFLPESSGNNVVWVGYDGNDREIYLYDGSSTIQLTNNKLNDTRPSISDNNVVWMSGGKSDREIYLYNGSSTIQLTNNSFNDLYPEISGNNVVLSGYDGNDREIYLYNGSSTIQLTDNSFNDSYPKISGNNVVWIGDDDGNDTEIYLYNGTSTIQVTDNNISDYNLDISGNNVVWVGSDGNTVGLFSIKLPLWSSVTTTLPADIYDLTLTGADNINGSGNSLNNTLTGNEANNLLFGKSGDDTLVGLMGSDRLVGGLGADTLTGDAGADRFIRKYSYTGVDTITDFNVAEDTFSVSASGFGGELVSGSVITQAQFTVGEAALDESDASGAASAVRFIYDSTTGGLFFDADGTGFSEATQVAQLSSNLAMTHANIFVFA